MCKYLCVLTVSLGALQYLASNFERVCARTCLVGLPKIITGWQGEGFPEEHELASLPCKPSRGRSCSSSPCKPLHDTQSSCEFEMQVRVSTLYVPARSSISTMDR